MALSSPAVNGAPSKNAARVGGCRLENHLGRHDPHAGLLLHDGNGLVHHPLAVAQPGHIGLRIGDACHLVLVDQEYGNITRGRAIGRNRKVIGTERSSLALPFDIALEQFIAQPSGRAQRCRIELRPHCGQLPFGKGQRPGIGLQGVIVQLVVILLQAQAGQRFRAERNLRIERGVEKRQQARFFLHGRSPDRRAVRHRRRRGHGGDAVCLCGTTGKKQDGKQTIHAERSFSAMPAA